MNKNLLAHSLLLLFVLLNNVGIQDVSSNAPEPETEQASKPSPALITTDMDVELSTPTRKVITFISEDQEGLPASENHKIPHLVLKRNGVLTPGYERTLEIAANNVPVYAPGVYAELKITTQHGEPGKEESNDGIIIWREKQLIPYTSSTQQEVRINFTATFNRTTKHGKKSILTPTDYFKYQISIFDMNGILRQSHTEEFAFLMENQWRTPLPQLLETEHGAAPNHLLVYYYDMIPFQSDMRDPASQIPRLDVERYIQTELIPALSDAIQTQSNVWELPWYPEWRNFRRDEDPKTLSVALGEYGIWFHGEAPSLGHSMISIRVDGSVGEYDNITDGLMSIFHHELFHNYQRNIALHFSGQASIAGQNEAWKMFSEGTAVLASSVGQPQIQFERVSVSRSYLKRANSFVGSDGVFDGGLNKSYKDIPYQTATYWRYLYEKCGGMTSQGEDPAGGMKVIRSVLETLYKGDLVEPYTSTDSVESMPAIMDHVLANSAYCPFHSYDESLSQFANAIYMLRLEDGRCLTPDEPLACGFYDPNGLYTSPPAQKESIGKQPITYIGGDIRASFGIDIIEISLSQITNGQSIAILFDRTSNSNAEFVIEVIKLRSDNQIGPPEFLDAKNGHALIDINSIDTGEFDRIGLVITRIDPMEKQNDSGGYTIRALVR
jgi:hypothetical protein